MPRADSRQRVLAAAVRTLADKGYAGSTARAVAATGGFAPGVIYYHFDDLTDLFVATARHTSDGRLARYRAELGDVTAAGEALRRLRVLYAEDNAVGHVAAVQELVAAAASDERLAAEVRGITAQWRDFAEETVRRLVGATPLAALIPVREAALVVVATIFGMEMLAHLDAAQIDPTAIFDALERLAAVVDGFGPG